VPSVLCLAAVAVHAGLGIRVILFAALLALNSGIEVDAAFGAAAAAWVVFVSHRLLSPCWGCTEAGFKAGQASSTRLAETLVSD